MSYQLQYADIIVRAAKLLPRFQTLAGMVPYEAKGILNSEILFMAACTPELFKGNIIESGRARGQSTLILSLLFPESVIKSIEYESNSPDVSVAAKRLEKQTNVELLFGDSEVMLEPIVQSGDIVLIDGPKMFRAVRLAIRLLATQKPIAVFIHDITVDSFERKFLNRFFPEAYFSDSRVFAEAVISSDAEAESKQSPHTRLSGFTGAYGYGFSLAYIPFVTGRYYTILLLISYAYDIASRIARL